MPARMTGAAMGSFILRKIKDLLRPRASAVSR
jgi:hypothetical protein